MSVQNFIAEHSQLSCLLAISTSILATALTSKYSATKKQLNRKTAENKHLISLVKEYELDQSIALEHLTAKKDKVIKGLRIQHAKWREDTWAKANKEIEDLKAAHVIELAMLQEQIKSVTELKWESAAAMATMNKKHQHAIAATHAELEMMHQEAMQERHYQFESKRVQYTSFFKILSQYNVDNAIRTNEKTMSILSDFERNYIRALNLGNKKNADTAITVAKKRMDKLVLEAQLELTKVNDEANAVILISSEQVSEKIMALIEEYEKCLYLFTNLLKQFVPLLLAGNPDKISENIKVLSTAEDVAKPLVDEIFYLVKEEVGEF